MASDRDLAIGVGIIKGLNNAVTNFQAIKKSRLELQQEQEKNKLSLQQKKLELKKLENELDPGTLAAEREKLQAETKAKTAAGQLSLLKAKNAEAEAKREAELHAKGLEFMDNMIRSGGSMDTLPAGVSVDFGNMSFRGPTPSAKNVFSAKDVLSAAKDIATQRKGLRAETEGVTMQEIEAAFPEAQAMLQNSKQFVPGRGAAGATDTGGESNNNDRKSRAKQILQSGGYDTSDAAVDLFLSNNPEF